MKKTLIALVVLVGSTFGSAAAQTVDAVFDAYYEATGGKALWSQVKNYTAKQAFRAGTASDYDMDIRASLDEQALYKAKTIMKRDFIYAIKGTDGWLKVPLGSGSKVTQYETKDLSDKERVNMRRELKDLLIPFFDYQAKGYIATLAAPETINGQATNQVELEGKGVKYNLFFSTATSLLVREKMTTLATGEVLTKDHTRYDKSAFGLSYPAESTYVNSADKRTVKVTTVMTFNGAIPPESFNR